MRAAKARAAEEGETLKELIGRAVAHEVGFVATPEVRKGRVGLPLIGRGAAPSILVTNEDIEAVFSAEDVEQYQAE